MGSNIICSGYENGDWCTHCIILDKVCDKVIKIMKDIGENDK